MAAGMYKRTRVYTHPAVLREIGPLPLYDCMFYTPTGNIYVQNENGKTEALGVAVEWKRG